MLRDIVVVVRTRLRATPLAIFTNEKSDLRITLSMGLRLAALRTVGASLIFSFQLIKINEY